MSTGAGGVITSEVNDGAGRSGVTGKIQWGNAFDDAGIEEMADRMAPRLGQSPMHQMAIDGADPDLLAVLLERLMNEYLEYREIPARVRRNRNLVYVSMGEDDEEEESAANISVPLVRALMHRLRGCGWWR